MSSREKILAAVKAAQPELVPIQDFDLPSHQIAFLLEKFSTSLSAVGGSVVYCKDRQHLCSLLESLPYRHKVTTIPELLSTEGLSSPPAHLHGLAQIDLAVLPGHFGVAENGAVWLTEAQMGSRVMPFICEHLAVVISSNELLPTMHEAYERIGLVAYEFGTFIAGPSKTADIEQSLVFGAHGPRTMTVYLIEPCKRDDGNC